MGFKRDLDYYEIKDEFEVIPKELDDKAALEAYYRRIGEKIKEARDEAGYAQSQVADKLGLTSTAIANYEAGKRQIPIHILTEFAAIFGKPLHFFLGPHVRPPVLTMDGLKAAIERFSEAAYIDWFWEIVDGHMQNQDKPEPMVPVLQELAKDCDFALRQYNERTGVYNYLLCKFFKPRIKMDEFLFYKKKVKVFVPPDPDDLVIAEIGDTKTYEVIPYKNVTPTKKGETDLDHYLLNVLAVVVVKIEKLVKYVEEGEIY